jgi:hypothetical protein
MKPFHLLLAALWILAWPAHEIRAQRVQISNDQLLTAL